MKDFTLNGAYKRLIIALKQAGYSFQTFMEYIQNPAERVIILRHDVDKLPGNALDMAGLEQGLHVCSSYYFRIVKQSFARDIMQEIAGLGHEIGYHYEDLVLAQGDIKKAIKLFEKHLGIFREIYPVKTICMHGSPLSKYDNRALWQEFSYRDFGIIGEPYLDIDFNQVLYLTDSGRMWDAQDIVVRDKIDKLNKNFLGVLGSAARAAAEAPPAVRFHSTSKIIAAAERGSLPDKIMINCHPQRWSDKFFPWVRELVMQNMKNLVKKYFFVNRRKFVL